jgi:hypothetical protein
MTGKTAPAPTQSVRRNESSRGMPVAALSDSHAEVGYGGNIIQ